MEKFAWLISVQGGLGTCYATYLFQGYGVGGSRDHIATLQQGSTVSAVVDGAAIKITNTHTGAANVSVLTFMGNPPVI